MLTIELHSIDRKTKDIEETQLAQSKVLKIRDQTRCIVKDERSTRDMLMKFQIISINQMSAQIKLQETWKASRDMSYPIELMRQWRRKGDEPMTSTRTSSRR